MRINFVQTRGSGSGEQCGKLAPQENIASVRVGNESEVRGFGPTDVKRPWYGKNRSG